MSDIAAVDVAVVGADPVWVVDNMNRLHTRLAGAVVRDYAAFLEALDDLEPGVPAVVLCSPEISAASVTAIGALADERPEIAVVATSDPADPADEGASADRAAATGRAVPRADDHDAIVTAVREALDDRRDASSVGALSGGGRDGPDDVGGASIRERAIALGLGSGVGSRLVTVTAGKGGVGATTVAINLAVGLEAGHERSVTLVDAHGATGDIGLMLGLAPRSNDDVDATTLTGATIGRLIARHGATGVDVVTLPTEDEHLTSIGTGRLLELLLALDGRTDYVIVDAPAELVLDAQLRTFSDHVIVVTTPELAAIKDTRVVVSALAGGDPERIVGLLNLPVEHRIRADTDDVARAIGVRVIGELPHDDHLAADEPTPLPPPRSGFGHAIRDLADRLVAPRA